MRWSIGVKIGCIFGAALILLMIVGGVSYSATAKLVESALATADARKTILSLEKVLGGLKDAETGQRGYIITGDDRYLQPFQGAQQAVDQQLRELMRLTSEHPREQQRLESVTRMVASKFTELQETIDLRRSKGFPAAQQVILTDRGKEDMDRLRSFIADIGNEEYALLIQRAAEEQSLARRTEGTIVIGILAAILMLVVSGAYLARNIASAIAEVSSAANALALGDLAVNVTVSSRSDEVGELTRSFSLMVDSLRQLAQAKQKIAAGDLTVAFEPRSDRDTLASAFLTMRERLRRVTTEMRESINVLSSSAQQIVSSTAQVATGATETATAVSETTTTVEEVKQTAQLSSQKAKLVSESAQRVAQIAQAGRKSVEESVNVMKGLRTQMESIAESIVRLSEQGQAIGEIMLTVNELAEQSNLLAVNASIEAAKAGEHGRGFGVVAVEVRNLAEQSKQATSQIRTILADIQKATTSAVLATEQGSKAAEAGVQQSLQTGDAVQKLSENMFEAANAAAQIAASSHQQMVGMDQVASAMENIKAASTENVASTRQAEAAARSIQDLGSRLKELVGQYRV
jgi:methyl-accepting chemotaxis protein